MLNDRIKDIVLKHKTSLLQSRKYRTKIELTTQEIALLTYFCEKNSKLLSKTGYYYHYNSTFNVVQRCRLYNFFICFLDTTDRWNISHIKTVGKEFKDHCAINDNKGLNNISQNVYSRKVYPIYYINKNEYLKQILEAKLTLL